MKTKNKKGREIKTKLQRLLTIVEDNAQIEIDESILYWCDKTHHLRKKIELADNIMMDLTDEVWAKLHNDTRKQ